MPSLINKYRPREFDDVVGQAPAVSAMRAALKRKDTQTFLLTGPSGVGKTTLARIGARTVGCAKSDIIDHNGTRKPGVEDIRPIIDMIYHRPLGGEALSIIVDEAHGLSKQAISALLEATEEPPPYAYWFIATTEPTKIPKPILTRCLHIALKPVRDEYLVEMLGEIAEAEKFKTPRKIIQLAASEAQGSPRQAISNLAAVADCKGLDRAAEILTSAEGSAEAIDMARILVGKANFNDLIGLIKKMRESNQNPESVRQTIRAYATAIALNQKDGPFLRKLLAILEAFEQPFNSMDQLTPLLLACARLTLK